MTFALQHALLYPQRAEGVHIPRFLETSYYNSHHPPLSVFRASACEGKPRAVVPPLVFNAANEIAVEAFLRIVLAFRKSLTLLTKHCLDMLTHTKMTFKPYSFLIPKPVASRRK